MEELYATIVRRNPGTKVDVLCYDTLGAPRKEAYRGMTIYRVSCIELLPGQFALPNPLELMGVLFQLSRYTYDIVHANTRFFDSSWWAWIYARVIGARSILTDHVASHPIHPNRTIIRIAQWIDKTIARWTLGRYDLVTATNTKTQEFLTQTLKCTNVALAYGGVDTKFYKPAKPRKSKTVPYVRKRFTSRDIIVTFSGRLIRTKGIMLFVQAIRQLMRSVPKRVYFVIAGTGELESEIAKALSHAPLNRRVFTTGALYAKEIKQLLQSTDIFVHPSYHSEGFPNAILEAAASGCFVIATKNGGTREIIDHNNTGLLIKQRDVYAIKRAIWWAITHPKPRKRMGQEARQTTIRRFDWRERADEFLALVQRLYLAPGTIKASMYTKSSLT